MAFLVAPQPLQVKVGPEPTPEQTFEFLGPIPEQRNDLLHLSAKGDAAIPGLHFDTVKYRRGPSHDAKEAFRSKLLSQLRQVWKNNDTETQFIKLANLLEADGCTLFGGLIDVCRFEKLIQDYEGIQQRTGSASFLHSYANLAGNPGFIKNLEYNDAFVHPLLVALIAYCMGGAVRIIDMRGKDTVPLSANAQDNMLHIDNTPFKDEYKVLVIWKKGEAKGPSGQNFAYLPGTHRGNRDIFIDGSGTPFSTERENLFGSHEAIDRLFAFQKKATGQGPTVVEIEYPEEPVTLLFAAGGLVHHRYRTPHGEPRSCVSAAFHLASDNPGALVTGLSTDDLPGTLTDFMMHHQGSGSNDTFLALLSAEAERVEAKIAEITNTSAKTQIIDTSGMRLSKEQLQAWRDVAVAAPSASSIKFRRGVYVSDALGHSAEHLAEKLLSAMMYDKHGLLQLILYEDGREETRKLARKRIGEMRKEEIAIRLATWLPVLMEHPLTVKDIPEPGLLRELTEQIGAVGNLRLQTIEAQTDDIKANRVMFESLLRLIDDLGEALQRCERPETYASTVLYLFWAVDGIAPFLDESSKENALRGAAVLLRYYVAYLLLLEAEENAVDTSA
ncbi:hypothetical protein GB937_000759 [Aspergillus fischeri]|nr:hypothetical protein GB937_000759 [Aspergillus fischeri]